MYRRTKVEYVNKYGYRPLRHAVITMRIRGAGTIILIHTPLAHTVAIVRLQRDYSVEILSRRTTKASVRNPTPNITRAADSSIFGDSVSCDNWMVPSLRTAKAGRARIAEIPARSAPVYNSLTQSLLPKVVSCKRPPSVFSRREGTLLLNNHFRRLKVHVSGPRATALAPC